MSAPLFLIDLPLSEDWDAVEAMRTTLLGCLGVLYPSRDYCETVGMIVAELLENAVKYGAWGPGVVGRLRVTGREAEVEIAVRNRLRDGSDAARLRAVIAEIDAARTPAEAYVERLRLAALNPGPSGGLGLARISYEGSCRLSAHFESDGWVEVRALAAQFDTSIAASA